MTVHCKACNHQWEVHVPLPISIPRFSVIVNGADAAGCPSCKAHGKGTLLVGPALRADATPPHRISVGLDVGKPLA